MKLKNGKNGTIIAHDLTKEELYNLLKVQIKMRFVFVSPQDESIPLGFIYLLDRVVENNVQQITISEESNGKKQEIVGYSTVLSKIEQLLQVGVPTVVFESKFLKKKLPLVEIVGDIKEEIINGCVFIDYNDGMFSIVNKPQNKQPNSMYYWEETGSVFIFGPSGPKLLFTSKFDSIEELICN